LTFIANVVQEGHVKALVILPKSFHPKKKLRDGKYHDNHLQGTSEVQ